MFKKRVKKPLLSERIVQKGDGKFYYQEHFCIFDDYFEWRDSYTIKPCDTKETLEAAICAEKTRYAQYKHNQTITNIYPAPEC